MSPSHIAIKLLSANDIPVFDRVAEDVFDDPVRLDLAAEFLHDPRHHIAVALDGGVVVGMASAVHYIHPDKPAQLFIDEVGVAPPAVDYIVNIIVDHVIARAAEAISFLARRDCFGADACLETPGEFWGCGSLG